MFFYKGEGGGKGNVYIDFNTIIMIQFANNFSKKVSQNNKYFDTILTI